MRTRTPLVLFVVLGLVSSAYADPPVPPDDRVAILKIEMDRGPVEKLAPFLLPTAHPLSRRTALRALGRIGDRGQAPEMLAAFLAEGRDLEVALWAAGIARAEELFDAIAAHLDDDRPGVVAAAARALGGTGKKGAAEAISPLLTSRDPEILAGALTGLARCRAEGTLERVAPFVGHDDARVRRAADFCCWALAAARKRSARKGWDGEPQLAPPFLRELLDPDPTRRLAGLRVLGSLLPERIEADQRTEVLMRLLEDPDPRVTQEALSRVFGPREGPGVDRFLRNALDHTDPKVRSQAAEALAESGDGAFQEAIAARFAKETDLRVRDDLAVALARLGNPSAFAKIEEDAERIAGVETVCRQMTHANVLLARDDALAELLAWITPTAVEDGDVHPVVAMTVIDAVAQKDDARVGSWLGAWIHPPAPFDFDDPYVAATAVGALAERGDVERLGALCADDGSARTHAEVRLALARALGDVASQGGVSDGAKARFVAWLQVAVKNDPGAWVQDAARSALEKLGEDVPPVETLRANEWEGLPAPSRALQEKLGIESLDVRDTRIVAGGEPWIAERGVLQIANALLALEPRVVFETTQGTFAVALEPDAAPVHCVSLVLSADAGVYTDTRWHRVVPSFVIQGGDPHGHGAGNAGTFLPDEITPIRYERGVLGMPKSRKDDGGCQLFFMLSPYAPLDERYTAYGRIVEGIDVIDRIRVGDRIVGARVEIPR